MLLYREELAQLPARAILMASILTVCGVLLLARVLTASKPGQKRPGDCVFRNLRIPESLSSTIPFVGHVIKYARNGHHYFSTLCLSTTLPIFTIRMANMKISLIKPGLTKCLPKVRHLTLGALVVEIFKRSLDLDESSCTLLKEEDELSRKFAPQLSRLFREEFIPVSNIRKHVEQLDGFIQQELAAIKDARRIHIEDWMFKCFVGSLGKLLWGGNDGPFGDPTFVSHLR